MTIPNKTFQQLVSDMVTQWGSSLQITPALSPGSVLLALFEAVGSQLDFLQAIAQTITLLSRAATSTGGDLDTWMADFNFPRLPATYAVGPVQLLKYTATTSIVSIQAATLNSSNVYIGGGLVQTVGGAVVYQLIPDASQTAYNATSNSYQFPIGATSITVTAQSVVAGSAYNVAIGVLSQLGSQMVGVDAANNTVPINNGNNAETDSAFRSRFILYLSTLAEATKSAILAAASGVQQGLQIGTQENLLSNGNVLNGSFTVFVDDGTGGPPTSLLTNVYNAVNLVRAFSVQPFVVGPNIQNATIILNVRLLTGYVLATVQVAVQNAIAVVVNALTTNQILFVSAVTQATLGVAGVAGVQSGVTINGFAADLVPTPSFEVRTNSSLITVGTY